MSSFPIPPAEPIYKQTSHTFHLIMTVITFGGWALLVWWWWAAMQNSANNRKRAQYQRDMARYQEQRWNWEQANQQTTYRPHSA